MTLFLTNKTSPAEIAKAKASGFVHGVKWYPAATLSVLQLFASDVRDRKHGRMFDFSFDR